mmetsp:Transcript_101250/g.325351  ORF Transcript_101250/g.325351 Transcript_101250/m.325351 type:complete len:202 (-) Transcript_101250:1272-1877(-)
MACGDSCVSSFNSCSLRTETSAETMDWNRAGIPSWSFWSKATARWVSDSFVDNTRTSPCKVSRVDSTPRRRWSKRAAPSLSSLSPRDLWSVRPVSARHLSSSAATLACTSSALAAAACAFAATPTSASSVAFIVRSSSRACLLPWARSFSKAANTSWRTSSTWLRTKSSTCRLSRPGFSATTVARFSCRAAASSSLQAESS